MNKLRQKGIITQVYYLPVILYPIYYNLRHNNKKFLDSNSFYSQGLSLSLYDDVKGEDQDFFIRVLRNFIK